MIGVSNRLSKRWILNSKLGQGAFGEIYVAEDEVRKCSVAVKVEKEIKRKQALKTEAVILRKMQHSEHFARFYAFERCCDTDYLVMQLLGPNLSQLRRLQPDARFSYAVCAAIGEQMITALEHLHHAGFIHRDVKPSNFVVDVNISNLNDASVLASHKIFLIDFGLSRKINGNLQNRKTAGFRGTSKYASINSHMFKELSRPDDLWSLFYALVEFLTGDLPWRREKDRDRIGEMKQLWHNVSFVSQCPGEMRSFMEHLLKLDFNDKPDYEYLRSLMRTMGSRQEISPMKFRDPPLVAIDDDDECIQGDFPIDVFFNKDLLLMSARSHEAYEQFGDQSFAAFDTETMGPMIFQDAPLFETLSQDGFNNEDLMYDLGLASQGAPQVSDVLMEQPKGIHTPRLIDMPEAMSMSVSTLSSSSLGTPPSVSEEGHELIQPLTLVQDMHMEEGGGGRKRTHGMNVVPALAVTATESTRRSSKRAKFGAVENKDLPCHHPLHRSDRTTRSAISSGEVHPVMS